MQYRKLAWTAARILFGLFFLYAPIMILIVFGGQHPPESVPAAARFTTALNETGFMNPALIAVLLLGGAAMLFDRSAPIGLLLLAPPIFVIAAFHWFLTRDYVWGSIWPLWFALLAWHYRLVFARLWERRR
ncbi:MAG: DoxX family protein [Sphingomonadales bacterium]|nr:MAG: DoxX family protein [Sphingomonadales bacterium]